MFLKEEGEREGELTLKYRALILAEGFKFPTTLLSD